jgi:hypothetical protein
MIDSLTSQVSNCRRVIILSIAFYFCYREHIDDHPTVPLVLPLVLQQVLLAASLISASIPCARAFLRTFDKLGSTNDTHMSTVTEASHGSITISAQMAEVRREYQAGRAQGMLESQERRRNNSRFWKQLGKVKTDVANALPNDFDKLGSAATSSWRTGEDDRSSGMSSTGQDSPRGLHPTQSAPQASRSLQVTFEADESSRRSRSNSPNQRS